MYLLTILKETILKTLQTTWLVAETGQIFLNAVTLNRLVYCNLKIRICHITSPGSQKDLVPVA